MSYGQHAPSRKGNGFLRSVASWVVFFATVFALVWFINTFVARAYAIPSGSMMDTIQIGDRVWSEKISYYFRDVEQGDIITFDEINGPDTFIKRVIATEGQTVDLIKGKVYVDGVELDEPYTMGKESQPLDPMDGVVIRYPYTVPEGYVWVMGDNRDHSRDSRAFGPVPVENISGHAIFIYWPLNHLGVL